LFPVLGDLVKRLLKDRFFWYVTILVTFIGILTVYIASSSAAFVEKWHLVFIPIQRMAFAAAVLVSSWRYGSRAGWLVCFVAGLFILARHVLPGITSLSQSEVTDILVESGFIVIGVLTSWFIGRYQERARRLQQSELKLRQAAEEWRTTFDSIAEPVFILSKDFRILRVNKAYANFFNGKPQEFIGKACYEVAHGTTEPVPECPHRKAIETRRPVSAELYNSDRETFWEASASPIFDEKGDIIASVHMIRDITENKKIQEQLIITDRLASVGELAAGIAHEINNPLTGVIGFAEFLKEKELSQDVREDVEAIYDAAQHAVNVVKNMLIFARKHESLKQSIQVNEVIRKTLELRAYDHKLNNISIITNLAPNLPEIMAHFFQLQQAFLNLIINAEYFMKEAHNGGKLTITTAKTGGLVRISFADDGRGINKENLRKLFNPFFTTKPAGKGTGLGLSICHGIITGHGGKIWAESELGKGATFIIELPIPDADRPQ